MNRKHTRDRIESLSSDINVFNNNLENYYLDEVFFGPSVYFYRKVIEEVRSSSTYEDILLSERFIEYLYATLASWGMHRMGPRGSKMEDFKAFQGSILSVADDIIELSDYKLNDLDDEKLDVIHQLRFVFDNLKVMRSESNLVANSKIIHYLLPDLCPPIDRQYTLRFFFGNLTSKNSPLFAKAEEESLFIEILHYFYEISKNLDLKLENYETELYFNTSIPKIIDNAIIGYVRSKNIKIEKLESAVSQFPRKLRQVYSIKCSRCGQYKAVRPEVYAKRIEKFGSEERLLQTYLCRDCRR